MKNLGFKAQTFLFFFLFLPCLHSFSQSGHQVLNTDGEVSVSKTHVPVFGMNSNRWVDSVFNSLTPRQRLGQLFMVAAYSNKGKKHVKEVKKLIKNYHIGGLIFFQGGPLRQAKLTNEYQKITKVPLLLSMDAEWGLAMRLDSTICFPRQMALGAIRDDSLIYKMGAELAREFTRLGMQLNFAPVVDVNSNPLNPVIGNRAFGEQRGLVTAKSAMYMKGLQDNLILANAKHFPGHGDTDSDSHKTLPLIRHSKSVIDSIGVYPYRTLIDQGLASIMVAHLQIPALDSTQGLPGTLSKSIVTTLLKRDLGFNGLIITDALNMKGVSNYTTPGEVDYKALLAGNDILLFADSIPAAIRAIEKGLEKGEIQQSDIDQRCKKILLAKYWAGLSHITPVATKGLYADLNSPNGLALNRKLVEASLTVIQNRNQFLPIRNPDTCKLLVISCNPNDSSTFVEMTRNYTNADHLMVPIKLSDKIIDTLLERCRHYNLIIFHLDHLSNSVAKNYDLSPGLVAFTEKLLAQNKVVLSCPFNPYALSRFSHLENAQSIVLSYENNFLTQTLIPQLIFGAIGADGKLPVSVGSQFQAGLGLSIPPLNRLGFSAPEYLGLRSDEFKKIDKIATDGISGKVYPGCQILVAYHGSVVFRKAYGNHLYGKSQPVVQDDCYDLASLTKVTATLPALMEMKGQGHFSLDDSLGHYLTELTGTNKSGLKIRQILTHQSGLRDWIPFWMNTFKHGQMQPGVYQTICDSLHCVPVAENLYLNKNYIDTIYKAIDRSELKNPGTYRYSDLGYYYFKRIVERQYRIGLDSLVSSHFYMPLGMKHTAFRPIGKIPLNQIIPTENDQSFRKQLLHGHVHDQGAAMLGGVGGHAGLFSNVNDLAILLQMYLQGGTYGGHRYLDSLVLDEFTRCQFCPSNRRGLGFDKPDTKNPDESPVCASASPSSYGHTGFTGTMFWVDPKYQLVYIFLSNRVYPSAAQNKLAKSGIRTKIQQVIYNAIPQ